MNIQYRGRAYRALIRLPIWVPVDVLPARLVPGQGLRLFNRVTLGKPFWRVGKVL